MRYIHTLHFQLKKQNHITFTKSKYIGFFIPHTAPEAVEIETGVISMLILLEKNMKLLIKMLY